MNGVSSTVLVETTFFFLIPGEAYDIALLVCGEYLPTAGEGEEGIPCERGTFFSPTALLSGFKELEKSKRLNSPSFITGFG